MSLSHPHWKISRTSASLVWEISKQFMVFSCFSLPKFDLFLLYLMERRASATYKISQANWAVFGWLFDRFRNNCHFWSCCISNYFIGICDFYLVNSLLNFYFGFDIENTIPVYIPTLFVVFHIKSPIIYKMLTSSNMLHFITVKNGLPYCLLWKIDILY